MPISHLLLAITVAIIWGVNFLFIKLGLDEMSPLLFCSIRFLFASVPAIFFIKRPAIPFKLVLWYGLIMFALHFSLLFLSMRIGMTPGMGSLIAQVQVFFTMLFAAVLLSEYPTIWQIISALVAFTGIGIVAMHFDSHISLPGFICMLAAAATWGFGNLISKKIKNVNIISLVVWGSFIAFVPTFLLSLLFEGPTSVIHAYHHITWTGISALLYIAYISTWIGYGTWSWLLSIYPVSMVTPFSLLVPVFALLTSVVMLGEPLQPWKLVATLLVISGLCINILSRRYLAMRPSEKKLIANTEP